MLTITKYNKNDAESWDNFICISNNGTIFQTRKFLQYHIKRTFSDYSLIIKKETNIVAVLPGAKTNHDNLKIFYSHPGASYGGFVLQRGLSFKTIHEMIKLLDIYLIKKNFQSIFLINSPSIYWQSEGQELDYLLLWNQYQIQELYISHAVNIGCCKNIGDLLSKRKKRYVLNDKNLQNFKFEKPRSKKNISEFYTLLKQVKKKFYAVPTHSLDEIMQLKKLFPDDIKIYISILNNDIVGGCVIFHASKKTSLIFYNIIDPKIQNSQLSALQLYNCMKICKKRGSAFVDFGVSHSPEYSNPLKPKESLIQFKEQFGAIGIMRLAYQKDLS